MQGARARASRRLALWMAGFFLLLAAFWAAPARATEISALSAERTGDGVDTATVHLAMPAKYRQVQFLLAKYQLAHQKLFRRIARQQ